MSLPKVLMFDDDYEMCKILQKNLASQLYEYFYITDPIKDFSQYKVIAPDIILLDVNFPNANGFDILKKLRAESKIPVIMLTARGEELDRVLGLELGADDYLPKPFYFRELTARINAVLRRYSHDDKKADQSLLCVEDLELNTNSMVLKRSGEAVELRSKEFELLKILMEKAGQVVSKEDLSKILLEESFDSVDRRIDVHLSRVRKKIGKRPNGGERIKTIRNAGVMLVSEKESS